MALMKAVATDFGADATYWNIGAYEEDYKGGGGLLTMYGYVTEQARQDGKQPLATAQISLTDKDYLPDMDRAAIYSTIKKMPGWDTAEDC